MVLNSKDDAKSILHRLIFVSTTSPDLADKRDLGEFWEQQFQQYNQGDAVTGILLLYPSCTIHVLESGGEVLYCVLRDLRKMKKQGERALVLNPKILVLSHNLPNRLFSQWSYKVLDVPGQYWEDKFSEEATDGIITECLTKILKIGKQLTKYPKGSKTIPDSLFQKAPELIIPQTSILHLLQSRALLTPDQFLEAYDSPLHVTLDSGHVFGSLNQTCV
ncbi:PREDICTED: uncharacterized protein C7orf62 homolog [Nanorana parkeri]|uniref:uncharacterized protein C7orf62 homolog n=1 Tax=Nanorana parkeri TaxID=125878 RepID=UPI000854A5F9|nr:PREDICTED: uncharacterized protein C7orf62 homolog [Nanorana parkeri]